MPEITVELFGIMRRLPIRIELMAGNLDAYEFLEPAHDETIIAIFGLVEQKLTITHEQFFMGCAEPAQRRWYRRVLGFVQHPDGIWTHSRCNGRFETDKPDVAHVVRNRGDIILVPASQPALSPILSPIFRTKTSIRF